MIKLSSITAAVFILSGCYGDQSAAIGTESALFTVPCGTDPDQFTPLYDLGAYEVRPMIDVVITEDSRYWVATGPVEHSLMNPVGPRELHDEIKTVLKDCPDPWVNIHPHEDSVPEEFVFVIEVSNSLGVYDVALLNPYKGDRPRP